MSEFLVTVVEQNFNVTVTETPINVTVENPVTTVVQLLSVGPQGAKGDPGEQGEPGEAGEAGQAGGVIAYTVRYEEISSTVAYAGYAIPGALNSASVWKIKKIITSAGITSAFYPNGDGGFTYIWDDRASYTYS